MRSIIFAFFAVFLPQLSLAAINHGVLVLAPVITASSELPPEAVGLIGAFIGLTRRHEAAKRLRRFFKAFVALCEPDHFGARRKLYTGVCFCFL